VGQCHSFLAKRLWNLPLMPVLFFLLVALEVPVATKAQTIAQTPPQTPTVVQPVSPASPVCTPSVPAPAGLTKAPVPGEVTCLGRACYYLPQVMDPNTLVTQLMRGVTGNSAFRLIPSDGYIELGRDASEISFWHRCQETLDSMKALVKSLDPSSVITQGRESVKVQVRIYNVGRSALQRFAFGVSSIYKGDVTKYAGPADKGDVTNNVQKSIPVPAGTIGPNALGYNAGYDLGVAFGNLTDHLLSLNLSNSRNRETVREIRDVGFEVLTTENINRSLLKKNYRDGIFGQPNVEETGYRISGRPMIDRSNPNEPVIVIQRFSLMYSVPVEGKNTVANVLNIDRSEVRVPRGRPYILDDQRVATDKNGRNGNLAFLENSRLEEESRFMIFISAWPTAEPPPSDVNRLPMNDTEVLALPKTTTAGGASIFQSATFNVLPTGNVADFDLIQFRLDQKKLTQDNYNRRVKITVSGKGMGKNELFEKTQHLARGTFQLPSSLEQDPRKPKNFRVKLEWESGPAESAEYQLTYYPTLHEVSARLK
jgi:hypothetical protein